MLRFAILLVLASSLQTENCSRVSSENASYDGQDLTLSGQVTIDHILGKMQTNKAILKKWEREYALPFSNIELDQEVVILLKHGKLTADKADFDLQKKQAILRAENGNNAIYQDKIYDKTRKQMVPFTIEGHALELQLLSQEKGKEYLIDSIEAKENVRISYADTFLLTAENAIYNQMNPTNKRRGTVSAYVHGRDIDDNCCLTREQDVVHAKRIDIDLIHSCLDLSSVNGIVEQFIFPQSEKSFIHFSTTALKWKDVEKEFLFTGETHIEQEDLGTISTKDTLLIKNCMVNEKLVFQVLDAKGHTIINYKDLNKREHRIESYGRLYVDQNKLQAWIESPQEESGIVRNQLCYETEALTVFADHAQLEYMNIDQHIKPVSIALKGHIRMFSKDPNKSMQLAVADSMSYSLNTKSIILSAYPGKKVLFWDMIQELKISAPEVHITRDPLTEDRVIRGIGNVHLFFNTEEQFLFNQHFPPLLSHE